MVRNTETAPSSLDPAQRRAHIDRMASDDLDVLVIGGGVTGCGVALDAASRGLRVALVEQRDYSSGTSSRSSKLFHGGLRYLEHRNFALVREALAERNLMLNHVCPHLASPVSFLYPLRHRFWERLYVGAGVLIYDLMASFADNPLPRHTHLSRQAALRIAPALGGRGLVGAVKYWDALVDDARHTLMLARTAVAHGALLASSVRATGLVIENGRVHGAEATNLETGREFRIRARRVINATGVWSDDIQAMAGDRGLDVEASKGIHIVVPKDRIRSETGLILRTEKSVLFVIPWDRHWIVGTTDTPWELRRAHPAACRSDIDYLLGQVNAVLSEPLAHGDIVGVYAGLRPLLTGESDDTSMLSREHAVIVSDTGLVSVAGGKYTTYRIMARDAVDAAVSDLGELVPASATEEIALVGATGWAEMMEDPARLGLPDPIRLMRRYGSETAKLAALVSTDSSLAGPLVGDAPYLRAEIAFAALEEGVLHLDDVLTRRTRISIETADRGLEASIAATDIVAPILGWDHAAAGREIAHYRARVEAERDSQRQPDDHTADAARMGAPDVRTGRSE
ncbi:MAG TPA: glycerol-3-phosphate dehydrogenase/oxidase [Acidimicrobiia bacterium]|nr:glycerol-3-phosphate dehydrogenase/oxidase [Acidimicrobiia bacterium]